MARQIEIPYKFSCRPYQKEFFDAMKTKNRAVLVWHRRCVAEGSHVIMSDGSYKPIEQIKKGDKILSYKDGHLVEDTVKSIWRTGVKECTLFSVYGSRHLCITEDHQILSSTSYWSPKWKKASEIGNRCAITYDSIPLYKENHNPELAEILGFFLTDSSTGASQQPKFTNNSEAILKRFEQLAGHFGMSHVRNAKGYGFDIRLNGGRNSNVGQKFLEEYGLRVLKKDKRIPKILFKMDRESVGRFFSSVIDSDGSIYIQKKDRQFEFQGKIKHFDATAEVKISVGESKDLAWDYYWLLRKFGIRTGRVYNDRNHCWTLRIWEKDSAILFLNWIKTASKEEARLKALSILKKGRNRRVYNSQFMLSKPERVDTFEKETWDLETENNHNFICDGYIVHNSGKDKCCWNFMIHRAIQKVGVYYYFLPSFAQGRKVLWDAIDKQGFRVLDHIPKEIIEGSPNSTEMKIRLKNGSLIQIIGTDNYNNSIIGTNPIGCVFSEYSLQDPDAWTYIRPILAENQGWAVFVFTPRGEGHSKELYDRAKRNPEWFCQTLSVDDTKDKNGNPIISKEAIEAERQSGMSEDFIQQEFYVSFQKGIEGSYYARLVQEAYDEKRIGNVPWDRHKSVNTAWDIGYGDATSIVFYQIIGNEIHIIDHYENQGESIAHYIGELKKKPYVYGDHFAPHDIQSHHLSTGFSCKTVAADLGVNFIVLPTLRTRVDEGIEAVRGLFPRFWIDEHKCARLIKSLQNYRKVYDSINGVYKSRPLHDLHSHNADAVRYLALATKLYVDSSRGVTDAEIERLWDIHRPIFT